MTVGEFQAWLDGYSEHMKGAPTKKQWERIQEKLAEVYEQKCSGCHHYPWTFTTITNPTWTISADTVSDVANNEYIINGTSYTYTTNAGEN